MKIQTLLLLFSLQSQQLQWFRINVLSNESSLECCHSQKEKKFQIKKFHHMEYDTHKYKRGHGEKMMMMMMINFGLDKIRIEMKICVQKICSMCASCSRRKKMGQNERISIKKKLEI